MPIPLLCQAQVIAQDPANDQLIVMLRSGQMPNLPVKMLHFGFADAYRISQHPMPQIGSHGIVCFPNGDVRNGLWLGTYYPNLVDATAGIAGDATVDYQAHWSGFWRYLDKAGTYAAQWPDGSSLLVGSGAALPTVFRHVVDGNSQAQRLIPYTMADRVPHPPSPFQLNYKMANGTSVLIDKSGNITINGAANVTINASGDITLNAGQGSNIVLQGAGAAASDALALISKLVAAFNAHIHTGVSPGGGDTGPPATAWTAGTAGTVSSTLIEISN